MLKLCLLACLAVTAFSLPTAIFDDDDGFRPIPPPADASPIYRNGKDLSFDEALIVEDFGDGKVEKRDAVHDSASSGYENDFSGGKGFGGGDFGGSSSKGFSGGDFGGSGGKGFGGGDFGGSGGKGFGGGSFGGDVHGGGGQSYGGDVHGKSTPTKTIYVNVPNDPQDYAPAKPVVAGPPRKHYRIVFIKSPSPPPPPQPILPPRVEQKTLIYVLHPKADAQGPKIVEFPDPVQHDPEVYFIRYDKEAPTADELQGLVKNSLDGGYGPGSLNFGKGSEGVKAISQTGGSGYGGGKPFVDLSGKQSGIPTFKSSGNSYQGSSSAGGFKVPSIATGYASVGSHSSQGARYSRAPTPSQPEVQFDGPFSRDRYERTSAPKPSSDLQAAFGSNLSKDSPFNFGKTAAARGLISSN